MTAGFMEKKLNELTGRLQKAFGDRLVSVILYGSAAGGDYQEAFSDLNVFCVLTEITPAELAASEPIFRWWREGGNPAPLLMNRSEVGPSTDCFPIEYQDMKERRRVLYGEDVVENLVIDRRYYRAEVEHELRSKLIRLRQKAAGVLHDPDLLVRLMADSVSTFLVLGRHALLLGGHPCGIGKRGTVSEMAARLGIDVGPFETLLDVRDRKVGARSLDGAALFGRYLKSIQSLVAAVDRLEK